MNFLRWGKKTGGRNKSEKKRDIYKSCGLKYYIGLSCIPRAVEQQQHRRKKQQQKKPSAESADLNKRQTWTLGLPRFPGDCLSSGEAWAVEWRQAHSHSRSCSCSYVRATTNCKNPHAAKHCLFVLALLRNNNKKKERLNIGESLISTTLKTWKMPSCHLQSWTHAARWSEQSIKKTTQAC